MLVIPNANKTISTETNILIIFLVDIYNHSKCIYNVTGFNVDHATKVHNVKKPYLKLFYSCSLSHKTNLLSFNIIHCIRQSYV